MTTLLSACSNLYSVFWGLLISKISSNGYSVNHRVGQLTTGRMQLKQLPAAHRAAPPRASGHPFLLASSVGYFPQEHPWPICGASREASSHHHSFNEQFIAQSSKPSADEGCEIRKAFLCWGSMWFEVLSAVDVFSILGPSSPGLWGQQKGKNNLSVSKVRGRAHCLMSDIWAWGAGVSPHTWSVDFDHTDAGPSLVPHLSILWRSNVPSSFFPSAI